jgi:SAM-dependent methyltransferase
VTERRLAEQRAWDDVAARQMADIAALEHVASQWGSIYDTLLDGLGSLSGMRVLDCGAGMGLLSRAAAERGAHVVGFDVSHRSLMTARAAQTGTTAAFLQAAFEQLPFADVSLPHAVGMFVLHHVELGPAARELARVLQPGGTAAFIETWQRNPLLKVARRLRGRCGVAMYGTPDEQPLQPSDLDTLRTAGFDVTLDYPGLVLLRLFDNNVLKGRWRFASRMLSRADRALDRVGPVKPYGYYVVIRLTRLDASNERAHT